MTSIPVAALRVLRGWVLDRICIRCVRRIRLFASTHNNENGEFRIVALVVRYWNIGFAAFCLWNVFPR